MAITRSSHVHIGIYRFSSDQQIKLVLGKETAREHQMLLSIEWWEWYSRGGTDLGLYPVTDDISKFNSF